MKDETMYLTKNRHGVYYYRRPIVAEDQAFWLAPGGKPKKEWIRSLRTKDRREAISRMVDAADDYEAERSEQLIANKGSRATGGQDLSEREREELAAEKTRLEAQAARREARKELRVQKRLRAKLSTVELSPEEAAWHDLLRERDAELERLREAVEGQRDVNTALGGPTGRDAERSVDALLTAYEADKSARWGVSTHKAVQPVFRFLRDVFAKRGAAEITREEARAAVGLLQELPTQIGKRNELAGLSIREAIARGRKLGLPTIQPKTINDGYLIHIAAIFAWAVREQWIVSSPFQGLSVADRVRDKDRRDPFKAEQLQTLFAATPWDKPWCPGREKPGAFWVPLLCLFHGLRLGEASGLRPEDVEEIDGVWAVHIREYEGRTIKTAGSIATLPLHTEVLAMGFLAFVEDRRATGEPTLFPDAQPNNRGQWGAKLGERFSARVKRLGFEGRKLGMHSFRHNFEDALRQAELPERNALSLARRAEGGSREGYGDGVTLRQMAIGLGKISYDAMDLSHLVVNA